MSTSVTKSLNVALSIFYQYLTKGEIPRIKSTGTISDEKWSELLAELNGSELSRFEIYVMRPPESGIKSPRWERSKTEKKIHFVTNKSIDFTIVLRKQGDADEWLFHKLIWQINGFFGRSCRVPPAICCD